MPRSAWAAASDQDVDQHCQRAVSSSRARASSVPTGGHRRCCPSGGRPSPPMVVPGGTGRRGRLNLPGGARDDGDVAVELDAVLEQTALGQQRARLGGQLARTRVDAERGRRDQVWIWRERAQPSRAQSCAAGARPGSRSRARGGGCRRHGTAAGRRRLPRRACRGRSARAQQDRWQGVGEVEHRCAWSSNLAG